MTFFTPSLRFFVLCAAMLLSAAAAAAQAAPTAPSHLSADPRVAEARALVETGRHEAALTILLPLGQDLDRRRADRTDILFLTGLAATGLARHPQIRPQVRQELLSHAIAAYRAILIDRPGLVRVRLELARTFFEKGDDGLARRHFERVLGSRPPPPVAANIRRFLAAIQARRRWSGHFGLTLAPDSNINSASDDDAIVLNVFGQQLEFGGLDNTRRSGVGIVIQGGGEYRHPLGERLRLRIGADAFRREYKGGDFDETFVSAHLGPQWSPDADTEASLLASGWHRWNAGKPQSRALGARLEVSRRFGPRLTANGRASWHRRDYPDSPHLDGPVVAASLGVAWQLTPTVRVDGGVGYNHEKPQSERWRNEGLRIWAGASAALPYGFTVGLSRTLRRTDYDRWQFRDTLATGTREDRVRSLSLSVRNRALVIRGFSPELVLVNEVRNSNAQLRDYRRNRAEMRFVRQF